MQHLRSSFPQTPHIPRGSFSLWFLSMTTNLAFNQGAEYAAPTGSLFLGAPRGLVDSIHRIDDTIFNDYKKLRKLDWDEKEFPLENAKDDFLRYPKQAEMMINNIGWQWSGDSQAANAIVPMVAPFRPSSDLWLWYLKQGENEGLHALSYSEIVRLSIPNGAAAIQRVHGDFETMTRVSHISAIFDKALRIGSELNLGMRKADDDEVIDALMVLLCSVLILERCQFMISFTNTAAIGYQNMFIPVIETVKKIATDEWHTHIPVVKHVLLNELRTARGAASMRRVAKIVENLLDEVMANEISWNTRQFQVGGELLGMTEKMSADYGYFSGTDVVSIIGPDLIRPNFPMITKNPLPFMDTWLDPNRTQGASMEMKQGNYLLGGVVKPTVENAVNFNTDDL